jgi:hypothetical protein
MSKNWIMLAGLLFLASAGTSQGHPLDSPDIVYVDGQPCNRACQSYLAWSRRLNLSVAERSAPVEAAPVASAPLELVPEKPVLRSAHRAPQRAAVSHRENSKPAARRVAKQAAPSRPAEVAKLQSASDAALNSEPAPSAIAAAPPADNAAAAPEPTTTQEQAATAPAEQVTAANPAPVPQQESPTPKQEENRAEAAAPGDSTPTASATNNTEVSAASNNTDNRVALLIARPEIASLSDLTGKDIAIEDQQSALAASISAAIMAAGAADVRLNEERIKAMDRLIRGEVSAAVLTLVSAEAAERFPEIPGYRIFRIPLSPDPLKARL